MPYDYDFDIGDVIVVTKQGCKYSNAIGVIYNRCGSSYKIQFLDGASSYIGSSLKRSNRHVPQKIYDILNDFDFIETWKIDQINEKRLENLKKEEDMDMEKKLSGFNKIAVITMPNGLSYNYALYDDNINVGDTVVVSGVAEGKLLTVTDILDVDLSSELRIVSEVVAKVDTSAYEQRLENRRRKEELIKLMDKKIAETKELDKYAEYAKLIGGDFAKMFEEFKSL